MFLLQARAGGSKGGNTTIQLYNLSQESIDIVSQPNSQVILEAGYYEDFEGEDRTLPIIFVGQTRSVKTVQSGEDRVTVIECTGGEMPNNYIKVSYYFDTKGSGDGEKPITANDVIEYCINLYGENGVSLGQYVGDAPVSDRVDYVQLRSPSETIFTNGYSFTGYLHQLMNKITSQVGYVWYITNGRLFVHPRGYTKSTEDGYILSLDIVKSIEPVIDNKKDKVSGVSVSTFLDARLSIDKQIVIEEGEYSGTYKIITADHSMDNELGAWDTRLTCQKLVQ